MSSLTPPPSSFTTPPPSPSKQEKNLVLTNAPKRQRGDDNDYKSYTLSSEFVPEVFEPRLDPLLEQLSPRGRPNTSSVTPPVTPTKSTKRA